MRIAVICRPDTANARYRAVLPMRELQRRGHTVLWPGDPSFEVLRQGGVPRWDVLHIQQFTDAENLATIERLKAAGVGVVWDTDDDIRAAPKGTGAWDRLGGRRKIKQLFERTVQIASAAHVMTTTSEPLAQVYRDAGVEHVTVIENYLAPEDLNGTRPRRPGVTVGIVAAGEHLHDMRKLPIREALERALREHPALRVVAIGVDLGIRDHRYTHHRVVPIEELLQHVRTFDIGLAPLLDTPFNRARSNVKLKEYAAAGAMWLASPVGPYKGMGEAQGGVLVPDEGWAGAVEGAVADRAERVRLAGKAREWGRGETVTAGASRWLAALRMAVDRPTAA